MSPVPVDFELRDVVVNRREISLEELDQYDMVIVGGGGGIANGRHVARTGVPMPIAFDNYRKTKTPFAFVALGHNVFEGDPYRHVLALSTLLAEARRRGDLFSVRNDGSLDRLRRDLGDAAADVVEIPDPGFFVEVSDRVPVETSGRPYILIQVAGDAAARRFRTSLFKRALKKLGKYDDSDVITAPLSEFAFQMWKRCGFDILVAPHIPADIAMSTRIIHSLYNRAGSDAVNRPFRLGGVPHPRHSREFFSAYASAELIVGMRGHSVICGVGLRRPTIAISTHPKIAGFMQTCGLGKWTLNLTDSLDVELTTLAESTLHGGCAAYFCDRDPAVASFREVFERTMSDIIRRALGHVPNSGPF